MLEKIFQIWNKKILTAVCFSKFEEEPEALTPESRSAIQEKIKFINEYFLILWRNNYIPFFSYNSQFAFDCNTYVFVTV